MSKMVHFEHPAGDGRKLKVGACKRDKHDPSHTHYEAKAWKPDELPGFVDLREHLTPIEDQGEVGSCTANALAGALEYLEKRTNGAENRVSRLFIYWNERDYEGSADKDHGAALCDGIKVLREDGACSEDTWEYSPDLVFEQPADHAYKEASERTIDEAHKVQIDLHDMRHCLAEGYPFVFGLQIYDAFQEDGQHGAIRTPDPAAHEHCGGHAMLCVGYSDEDQVFLVRNSWGEEWGDGGYCYIPYDYMSNKEWCHDAWTIRRAHNLDFGQGAGGGELPHGPRTSFFNKDDDSGDSSDTDDTTGLDDTTDSDDTTNSDDTTDSDDSSDTTDSDDTSDSSDSSAEDVKVPTDEELENKSVEELEEEIKRLDEEIKKLDEES